MSNVRNHDAAFKARIALKSQKGERTAAEVSTAHAEMVLKLIAEWFEDCNENHPHSGLKMRSPREFRSVQTATA